MMSEKNYYSKETEDFANESMRQIKSGAVRNHKLKNSARIHTCLLYTSDAADE